MRLENWHMRFSEFLRQSKDIPFEWGKNDCICFVAKAVESITGKDYLNSLDDWYSTKDGAYSFLNTHFDGQIENVFLIYLGNPKENVRFAHRGDVVLVQYNGELVGGLIDDSGRKIVCTGLKGLVRLPKSHALKYWSV
jgi:hypothetical protein